MNKNLQEGIDLCKSIIALTSEVTREVIISAPYIHLATLVDLCKGTNLQVAAQNCHHKQSGAYTGEVSTAMLAHLGLDYVIIGHSERRAFNAETNSLLAEKIDAALSQNLKVIYCFGETLEERKSNVHFDLVRTQITEGVFHLSAELMTKVVFAYEPVWAIGTGETASSEQVQEMHAHIRQVITSKYGSEVAQNTSILYGGSCKPSNSTDLFSQTDVDGGLIGGASLKVTDFVSIIKA